MTRPPSFMEKFKNKFIKTSLWPSLPHMNTTKNHSRNFFLSLLYSNAFAQVFEGLLFHKVEVRSRNPIYFDFTLMRYLLRTKAEKLFLLCRAINERTFVEKKDVQSRISVHQTWSNLIFIPQSKYPVLQ